MATLRTVINRVLGTIGETQIAPATVTITDTYQLQVLEFINQIKEEIEGATQWRALTTNITAAVLAGNTSVTLAGTNERSQLIEFQDYLNGRFAPLLFNVTNSAAPLQCVEHDAAELAYQQLLDSVSTSSGITDFAIGATSATNPPALTLQVYPRALITQPFKGQFYVPQVSLQPSDLDTSISVPERVLVQGVVWFALEERGEELGQSGMWTEERFRKALDEAVSTDIAARGGLQLVAT